MELREAALASMKVASGDPAELQKREEALTLEAAERTCKHEHLETTEHWVTRAEDDVVAREARVAEEVGCRVAMARLSLERKLKGRLELVRTEAEGRTNALRAKLEEATKQADVLRVALEAAQGESATSHAEVLLLRQQLVEAEAVARPNADEMRQRWLLEHEHAAMLSTLRERANTALGIICEAAVGEPRAINYAGNLQFFTNSVT